MSLTEATSVKGTKKKNVRFLEFLSQLRWQLPGGGEPLLRPDGEASLLAKVREVPLSRLRRQLPRRGSLSFARRVHLRLESVAKVQSNHLLHPSHTPRFPFYAILEGNRYLVSRFLLRRAMGLQTLYSGIYIWAAAHITKRDRSPNRTLCLFTTDMA